MGWHGSLESMLQGTPSPARRTSRRAFSVIEMLIVIAILGALSAAALAFYGRYHRDVVMRVRDQRNAQEITALTMGATAAGAAVIELNNTEQTIHNLIEGRNGTVGTFKGHLFQLPAMTPEEIAGAMRYLAWKDGILIYLSGDHPAS